MVQYKSNNFKNDDYWKLPRHVGKPRKFYQTGLNTLNYKFNVSTTRPRLAYLVSRAQRGFMSYEKRSLKELKAFCTARKIQVVDKFAGKRQLLALLEREDDAGASFNRFFDLPPELRNRIYSFYMDAIDDFETGRISRHRTQDEILTGHYKPPPPITQVCSTMRKETLPIFYDVVRLMLTSNDSSSHGKASSHEFGLQIIPPPLIRYARKILLHGFVPWQRRAGVYKGFVFEVNIEFATPHKPVTIGEPAIPAPWCWELSETERTVVVDAVKQQLALFLDARQGTASTMTMLTKDIFEELIGICGRVTKEANTQLE